jgi:hypothetical protein
MFRGSSQLRGQIAFALLPAAFADAGIRRVRKGTVRIAGRANAALSADGRWQRK